MISRHYKLFIAGQDSFRAMRDMLPQLEFMPGMDRGFKMSKESDLNRVKGLYIYTRVSQVNSLDPETLEPKQETETTLAACRFEVSQQKGLVFVRDRRGDLNPLYEALDSIPGAHFEFEQLNLNLHDLFEELERSYRRNVIKSIKIRDYLARDQMITSATFKLLDPQDSWRIMEKFADQIDAVTMLLRMPDGDCNVKITRKGSVSVGDDAPDDLLLFIHQMLPRFHEAEVTTVAVVDPGNRALAGVR